MIKNHQAVFAGWFLLLGGALLQLGCGAPEERPGSFQGLVELEERTLAFEVPGRVGSLGVKRGDAVAAGAALAQLEDTLARTAESGRQREAEAAGAQLALLEAGSRPEDVRAASAQLRAARASEALLAKQLERERELVARGVSTQAVLEELEARHRAAVAERQALEQRRGALAKGARPEELRVAEARAAAAAEAVKLDAERVRLHTLRARHPGAVLDVHVEEGEVVAAGAPVVTLADLDRPYADVFVPVGQLGGVQVGAAASVRVDGLEPRLSGRVEDVARRAEFTPRFVFSERERPNLVLRVRVRVEDPAHLLHAGQPAFVELTPEGHGEPRVSAR